MGLSENCVKLLNGCIVEANSTEIININISDIARLLNGNTMCIETDRDIRHIEIRFKEVFDRCMM